MAIPKTGSPQEYRAWWQRLTAQQQQDLIQQNPRVIGNLNGLPAWARNATNRIAVKQDVSSGDPVVRANASYTLRGLQAAYEKTDPQTGEPPIVQLYAYDGSAFGGEGKAAIAVGDIDKADNVVFSVPGIGNNGASLPTLGGRAGDIYIASRNADPTQSTAVIAWLGYNAPVNGAPPSSEFEANQGAPLLAADINGVRALREGDQPHITAIGHSYGGVVVGRAAVDHHAFRPDDDIVLVGSIGPGDGITKASDLGVAPGNVHVGTAGKDVTIYAGGFHGPDPLSDDFGAIRFAAETNKSDFDNGAAHGSYFDPNSESLYNIGLITSGHGDSVIREPGIIRDTTNPSTHHDSAPHAGTHDHAPHVSSTASARVAPTASDGAVGPAAPAPTNALAPAPVLPTAVAGLQRDRVSRGME